jgi:hypothetical protein
MEDAEEPFRQLSQEEFERLQADIRQSRRTASNPKAASKASPPEQDKSSPGSDASDKETEPSSGIDPQGSASAEAGTPHPYTEELGHQIWEWKKAGLSRYEIHRKLSIPMAAVEEILVRFEHEFIRISPGKCNIMRLLMVSGWRIC